MSISRNAAYNVLGAAFPSLLTLVTVPLYLSAVGLERFGVLTLCWVILGYSGFLDVGLGLAVARRVANAQEDSEEANRTFWTAAWLSILTGLAGAALIYCGANAYFAWASTSASKFQNELAGAIPLLAATVPLLMLNGVFAGVLQGRERFLTMNVVAMLGQSLMTVLPLAGAYLWSPDLRVLVGGALAARLLPFPVTAYLTKRVLPVGRPRGFSPALAGSLLGFSGWVSLTVIANTVLVSFDRLAIGVKIGAAAVPIYTIPYSLVSRIILVPHSLSAALFPRFAAAKGVERQRLAAASIQSVPVLTTPAIIGIIAASELFFRLWIGAELAAAAVPVAYILAGGFWFYCIGHIAYSILQATGRPDLVSKVLVAELPFYVGVLVLGTNLFGVAGAAAAVSVRAVIDCLLFLYFARVPAHAVLRRALPATLVIAAVGSAAALPPTARYVALALLLAASMWWSLSNVPDTLRPALERVLSIFPAAWRRRLLPEG